MGCEIKDAVRKIGEAFARTETLHGDAEFYRNWEILIHGLRKLGVQV
jgi:hypothetical protein